MRIFLLCFKITNWYIFCSWIKVSVESSCCRQYKCGSDGSVKAFDGHLMSDNVMLLKMTVLPRCVCFQETPWIELRSGVQWGKPDLPLYFVFQLWSKKNTYIGWEWQNSALWIHVNEIFKADGGTLRCLFCLFKHKSHLFFFQSDSDVWRRRLCLLLLCLQLQRTQWSSTCVWTSGGMACSNCINIMAYSSELHLLWWYVQI